MKKELIIAIVLLIAFISNISATAATGGAIETNVHETTDAKVYPYPFEHNGKWGYMDKMGNVKVEPEYDAAYYFSEGLALVRTKKRQDGVDYYKYAYIDQDGNIAIPIRYDHATSFIDGNAVVERNNNVEEEDQHGWRIEGYRYWIKPNGKYFLKKPFYDVTGIDDAESFHEGLALIQVGDLTTASRYIDKKGNFVIGPYDDGSSFNEGLAAVSSFFSPEAFDEGIINVGYINKKGEMIIPQIFNRAGDFSEGLAPVCVGDKWGYIDKQGEYKIPLTYQDAHSFSEGIAAIKQNGKWGFIDKNNKMTIEPQYQNVDDCVNGLIMVKDSKKKFLYYIDTNNKEIKPLL